jgi:hypothetical protein
MTLWSSRALIIFWRIKSDDKPRIPPPSTKVSITMAWHLEVIYLVIEAEVDVSFRENIRSKGHFALRPTELLAQPGPNATLTNVQDPPRNISPA